MPPPSGKGDFEVTFSLVLAALTGFAVSWTTVPSGPGRNGSAMITVVIEREDLVSVFADGEAVYRYELTAEIAGGYARAGADVSESDFPVVEELFFDDLSTGTHELKTSLLDLETGETVSQREDVVIDSTSTETWSSSGLRLTPSGTVRAAGSVTIVWDVYPPVGSGAVRAAYAVLDHDLNAIREGWLDLSRQSDGIASFSSAFSLGGLERGVYRVNTAALGGESEVMASSTSSIRLLSSWDLWGDDPTETATLVRPIASSREISELESAPNPGERQAVMSEFWLRRDPNPSTRENEYLDTYRRRLDYIERSFTSGVTRGILTDMGVTWAKLGEPDMVENHPFQVEGYPFQIWTWFNPRLTLLFIDRFGYGLYEFDGDWQDVNRAFSLGEAWYVY